MISNLIASYGYWAVFVLVAVESLGIPLPGETALITAAIYAGHTHRLSPWLIFAVAAAGAIIGDNIGYWIGDKGGYRLAQRYGPKVRLDERKLKIARYLFDTHGGKVVFFGRFVSVLRTYAAFLAGTSKMRWRWFFVANAAGGIIWAGIYTFAAYFAGHTLQQVSGIVDWVLIGLAVVAIAAIVVLIRRQIDRLAVRAEAAYPGPLSTAPPPSRQVSRSPRANAGPKVPPRASPERRKPALARRQDEKLRSGYAQAIRPAAVHRPAARRSAGGRPRRRADSRGESLGRRRKAYKAAATHPQGP